MLEESMSRDSVPAILGDIILVLLNIRTQKYSE